MGLMLIIRYQTYAYDPDLYLMLSRQLFKFSLTSPGAMRLGRLIFIFHFFGRSIENVNLALFGPLEPP